MNLKTRDRISLFFKSFFSQISLLSFAVIAIRTVELLTLDEFFYKVESDFSLWTVSIGNELNLILVYSAFIALPLAAIPLLSQKAYSILFSVIFLFVIVFYLVSTQYFYTVDVFLDHVLFYFSTSELLTIADSELGNAFSKFIGFYIFTLLAGITLLLIFLFRKKTWLLSLSGIGILLLIDAVNFIFIPELATDKQQIAASKTFHVISDTYESIFKEAEDVDFVEVVKRFRNFQNYPMLDMDFDFPLSHQMDLGKDSISNYFFEFDQKPNVVMLFCEGLGSSFSGSEAYLGSMTPFLDSLYSQGLYWPNTLSNTDRTHGIFANALAAMPHAFERGALNYKTKSYPQHFSLPKYLISNGYDASFMYGGWAYFDNYEPYLNMNYVEKVYGEKFFEENYGVKAYKEENKHSWGIPDQTLLGLYFELKEKDFPKSPYLNIILTLNLHSPFAIPDQEKYLEIAEKRFMQENGDKELFEKEKDVLASIVYTDDALRKFMNKYKERPDYANTIFVLMGDHKVLELPNKNVLDRYHVPLLFYSPKLKKAKKFKDIVNHTDIPASLVRLLEPYLSEQQIPKRTSLMGTGLSFQNQLKSTKPIYLGSFSGSINGVLKGDKLLFDDILYEVKEGLLLEEIKKPEIQERFHQALKDYRTINHFVFEKNRLMQREYYTVFPNAEAAFFFPE